MTKVILLTGIHGVGKKYISSKIKAKIDIPIYSASSLIRINNYKSDENKKVDNIDKNQEILSINIKKYIQEDLIILDSHTCLLDNKSNITKINNKWLKELNIIGIILLNDDLEIIQKRLLERDNLSFDLTYLKKFNKCEKETCFHFSKEYNIPLIQFKNSDDINPILDFILTIN